MMKYVEAGCTRMKAEGQLIIWIMHIMHPNRLRPFAVQAGTELS